eukprot:980642_1
MRLKMNKITDTSWIEEDGVFNYDSIPTLMMLENFTLDPKAAIAADTIEDICMEYALILTDVNVTINPPSPNTLQLDGSQSQSDVLNDSFFMDTEDVDISMSDEDHDRYCIWYFVFFGSTNISYNTDIRSKTKGIVRNKSNKARWADKINDELYQLQKKGFISLDKSNKRKSKITICTFDTFDEQKKKDILDIIFTLLTNKELLTSAPFTKVVDGAFNLACYTLKSKSNWKIFKKDLIAYCEDKELNRDVWNAWIESAETILGDSIQDSETSTQESNEETDTQESNVQLYPAFNGTSPPNKKRKTENNQL